MGLTPRVRLWPYEIVSLLGAGGMGEIAIPVAAAVAAAHARGIIHRDLNPVFCALRIPA